MPAGYDPGMGLIDRAKAAAGKGRADPTPAGGPLPPSAAEPEVEAEVEAELGAAPTGPSVIWTGISREEGRNSRVVLYSNYIERIRPKGRMSLSKAKQDTEVIPMKSVSSVQAKKDGLAFTKVIVFASGNTIEFRLRHDEAQRFKDEILKLVLG